MILIALNLRPLPTAIGPPAPCIDARLALGVNTGLGHPAAPLAYPGSCCSPWRSWVARARPLLGAALLLLARAPCASTWRAAPCSSASAALCGLGSALLQGGAAQPLIKEGFAQRCPWWDLLPA